MNWFKSFWKALNTPMSAESADCESVMRNLTPRAHRVLALAREEAARLNHHFVGTEHLLLGLLRLDDQSTAVVVLRNLGIDLEAARLEVKKQVGAGSAETDESNIPYAPRVKSVLMLAAKEAKSLNHKYVGTEHLLLGLLQEGECAGTRVLLNLGVKKEEVRSAILKELDPAFFSTSGAPECPTQPPSAEATVDTSLRYDVYCSERNQDAVVYRNVLFKGRKALFKQREFHTASEFVEIEQENGEVIFVSSFSIIKFCKHGTGPGSESASGKKP